MKNFKLVLFIFLTILSLGTGGVLFPQFWFFSFAFDHSISSTQKPVETFRNEVSSVKSLNDDYNLTAEERGLKRDENCRIENEIEKCDFRNVNEELYKCCKELRENENAEVNGCLYDALLHASKPFWNGKQRLTLDERECLKGKAFNVEKNIYKKSGSNEFLWKKIQKKIKENEV